MLSDETRPTTYHLFDHSYKSGSWNGAVLEQAAALRKRAETAEAKAQAAEAEVKRLEEQTRKLVPGAMESIEQNNRLRYVADAFYAYRQHTYFCDECGDGEWCEEGEQLYGAAVSAVDSVCGKPSEKGQLS